MKPDSKDCSERLLRATKKFFATGYWPVVEKSACAYAKGDYKECSNLLHTLPSDISLLEGLLEKVKGKPVYSTLKKVLRNESVSKEDAEIAVSSLITRTLIESKDNKEYRALLPDLLIKLQELIK